MYQPIDVQLKDGGTETYFTVMYACSDPKKAKEVPQELMATALQKFLEQSRNDQLKIGGIVAEASDKDEDMLDKVGAKRLYFEKGKGLQEIPFHALPMDDAEHAQRKHLTVNSFGGELGVKGVRGITEAINHEHARPDYMTEAVTRNYIEKLANERGESYEKVLKQQCKEYKVKNDIGELAKAFQEEYESTAKQVNEKNGENWKKLKNGPVMAMGVTERAQQQEKIKNWKVDKKGFAFDYD